MKKVNKPWGSFTDFYHTDDKHIKIIEIDDNARLSLQSHKKRGERWTVVEGIVLVTLIKMKEYMHIRNYQVLEAGSSCYIANGWIHRMQAINGPAKVMEIADGKFDEKDIKRYEDDYDRKGTKTV